MVPHGHQDSDTTAVITQHAPARASITILSSIRLPQLLPSACAMADYWLQIPMQLKPHTHKKSPFLTFFTESIWFSFTDSKGDDKRCIYHSNKKNIVIIKINRICTARRLCFFLCSDLVNSQCFFFFPLCHVCHFTYRKYHIDIILLHSTNRKKTQHIHTLTNSCWTCEEACASCGKPVSSTWLLRVSYLGRLLPRLCVCMSVLCVCAWKRIAPVFSHACRPNLSVLPPALCSIPWDSEPII